MPIDLPRLALVSPVPPSPTGVADYAVDLCAALEVDYVVDIVTDSVPPGTFVTSRSRSVSPTDFLKKRHGHYDRVLYQIGNSRFHIYVCELLHRVPGDVILHDIVLSDLLKIALCGDEELDLITKKDLATSHESISTYGHSIEFVTQRATSVIVHSRHAKNLISDTLDPRKIHVISQIRRIYNKNREKSKSLLGLSCEKILVCSFGIASSTKLNHLIAHAADFAYHKGATDLVLAFVGDAPGNYGQSLRRHAQNAPYEVRITGRITKEVYGDYLAAADIAVQLRGSSKGESSRAILDTMSSGIPTITNPVGSMAEIPEDCTHAISVRPNQRQLGNALLALRNDQDYRRRLGERARSYVEKRHSALHINTQLREIFAPKLDDEYQGYNPTPLCIDATELIQIADPDIRSAVFRSIVRHYQETGAAPKGIVFGTPSEGAPDEILPLGIDGEHIKNRAFCRPRRACSMISWRPPHQRIRAEAKVLTVTSPEEHESINQAIRSLSLNINFTQILIERMSEEKQYFQKIYSDKQEYTIFISSSASLHVSYLIDIRRSHTGVIFCEDLPPLRHFFGSRAIYAPANISFAASCTMLMLRSQLDITA
ncbi:glycosyltransferase family 4 protein [Brevundimonas faecalis]|uniref:Glycosyltransferase involved in cell wall biosynthesis n=1 Tax=Brevundimonas faecalis TaxID=947378 RepID=A0ABV2R6W2_9CAUL